MFVNAIGAYKNLISFKRRLTPSEEKDYTQNAIKPALDYLGTEEVAMIIHGTSYPEADLDIGVGSPYGKVAAQLMPFEMLHGFNSNQLGPVGVIRDPQHISPYKSTVSTRNYLFIDFNKLATDEYANILPKEVVESVFNKTASNGENYSYSQFQEAFANYDYCIKYANHNFKKKLQDNDPNAIRLNEEFKKFRKEKGDVVYKDALFDVLSNLYNTQDFTKWDDIDRDLISLLNQKDPAAKSRYQKVIFRSRDDFESYVLGQFLLDKQINENTKLRKSLGYKYISDLLVGFSPSDEWANQDLFLKDYRMGCPNGGEYGPQLWDVPVLNPKRLFNDDGTLGPAGVYLKKKLDSSLDDFDNVRIDHALGLIDPYIYDRNSVVISNGKIDLSKFRANNISNMPNVDPDGKYRLILEKIILPSLKEHGLAKDDPVWEDLCAATPLFNSIYHDKYKLPGLTQLEWMRGENYRQTKNWGLVGSHDSDPANLMIKKDWVRANDAWNIFYLAGLLNANPARSKYRDEFCKSIEQNDSQRVKAKFAELFLTCKKVQISFADFFGINKTYNKGGSENDTNWKLRLNKDYEDTYYKNLASEHPTAINMPEVLKMAVQAKSDMEYVKYAQENKIPQDKMQAHNTPEVQQILANLDKYEKILQE